ncbi:MAG: hypothetical protein E7190_12355 [Erysipelotrichaceae bacterium]|nr:hypothetical protein [Erysipelotrichaceae bacterium]
MCEVLNTAVRKAVAQERQKAGRINAKNRRIIKAQEAQLKALYSELERLRKEHEYFTKIMIAAGYSA